jgi:Fic family protein
MAPFQPPTAAAERTSRLRDAIADHEKFARLARAFRALGDPTRSKMVYALWLQETRVSELAEALGVSLSGASRQLRILRELDIVRERRQGKSVWYGLNRESLGFCAPDRCPTWRQARLP